ncbi:MAG TPA: hypothetical protein VKU02_10465 [Gemmataceae bacterium]|nr:hypothetical protein [Gemmataceae bacterium]
MQQCWPPSKEHSVRSNSALQRRTKLCSRRILDVHAFEQALARWVASRPPEGQERLLSLEGKTARQPGREVPRQHLVAAYGAEAGTVLGQVRVDPKTNEHKAALRLWEIAFAKPSAFSACLSSNYQTALGGSRELSAGLFGAAC